MYVFTGVVVFLFSCRGGQLDIAKWILQRNPSTSKIKDDFGRTPLHIACQWAPPSIYCMFQV